MSAGIAVPQDGDPEAIFTWVRLPQGGIRLYASRHLDVTWGQRERDYQVKWHLESDMDQVLIVDRPTAAEALMWVLERWAREDASSPELAAGGKQVTGGNRHEIS